MIGTEVLGQRCCINEKELLGPSNGPHRLPDSQPCGPVKPLHIDLFQDLAGDRSLQEVLGILVGHSLCNFKAWNWAKKSSVHWQGP